MLTGDWEGIRTRLKNAGIDLRAEYLSESAANPSGGRSQAVRYTQQIDFGLDLDLGRLAVVPHGKVQITFTDRVGRSLSADLVGSQFGVQTLYGAGQNFRLSELNYQQDLLQGNMAVGFGWTPVGDDFARPMVLCSFHNDVFCGHANAMTTNSGADNFPTAEWGAHVKLRLKPSFYAATGIYQVKPDEEKSDKGFDLSFRSSGVFIPVEFGWVRGEHGAKLPGFYKFGAYYNSSATPDAYGYPWPFRRTYGLALRRTQWALGHVSVSGANGLAATPSIHPRLENRRHARHGRP